MFLPIGFNLPFFRFPVVTCGWVITSLFLFFVVTRSDLQGLSHSPKDPEVAEQNFKTTTTYKMAFVPAEHNAPWKFITYQFAHMSWGHLFANMWYFVIFGWILENAVGGPLFLMLTLFFGGLAVVPEVIFQSNPTIPIVGASGSVAFLMGCAAAMFPRSRVRLLFMWIPLPNFPNTFFIPIRYLIYMWLAMQVSGLAMNVWVHPRPVAYATHLLGFAFGLAAGFVLKKYRNDQLIDIELSGQDLKSFYSSLKAYQSERIEEANAGIEKLSLKKPWSLRLQLQFFKIAVIQKQRGLADRIWRVLLPQLLVLQKSAEAKWAIENFYETFNDLPPLQLQEKVILTRLLKGQLREDEEMYLSLQRAHSEVRVG